MTVQRDWLEAAIATAVVRWLAASMECILNALQRVLLRQLRAAASLDVGRAAAAHCGGQQQWRAHFSTRDRRALVDMAQQPARRTRGESARTPRCLRRAAALTGRDHGGLRARSGERPWSSEIRGQQHAPRLAVCDPLSGS